MHRFGKALYRTAGIRDIANLVVGYLWSWILRSGITREQVLQRILQLMHCDVAHHADVLPSDLLRNISRILAAQEWNCGDFAVALEEALSNPPPGFRWRADEYGRHVLVEVKSDVQEHAIVRGQRFADSIFVGLWWITPISRGAANQRLQRFVRKHGGSVFWNEPHAEGRQYGAFLITDRQEGETVANELCRLSDEVDLEGGGEHRLSAISMAGIAEHREVRSSDQVWIGCIRSIKFNWQWSLPDLLNGRIDKFRSSTEYKKLIKLLREQ